MRPARTVEEYLELRKNWAQRYRITTDGMSKYRIEEAVYWPWWGFHHWRPIGARGHFPSAEYNSYQAAESDLDHLVDYELERCRAWIPAI